MSEVRKAAMLAAGAVIVSMVPDVLNACPSCFGAADAPMTQGMNMGILSLLGVTGSMLVAFGSLFLRLRKRARAFVDNPERSITIPGQRSFPNE